MEGCGLLKFLLAACAVVFDKWSYGWKALVLAISPCNVLSDIVCYMGDMTNASDDEVETSFTSTWKKWRELHTSFTNSKRDFLADEKYTVNIMYEKCDAL